MWLVWFTPLCSNTLQAPCGLQGSRYCALTQTRFMIHSCVRVWPLQEFPWFTPTTLYSRLLLACSGHAGSITMYDSGLIGRCVGWLVVAIQQISMCMRVVNSASCAFRTFSSACLYKLVCCFLTCVVTKYAYLHALRGSESRKELCCVVLSVCLCCVVRTVFVSGPFVLQPRC